MKVIFLDVDGVLNCNATKEMIGSCVFVDDQKIDILQEIVECTGAKLVLSSTWRLGWARKELEPTYHDEFYEGLVDKLREHGLELYARTPIMGCEHRGREIDEWLRCHPEVESFVILDDDSDMDEHIGRLVKTSWIAKGYGGGLLRKHVKLAINMLNKPYVRRKTATK